MLVIEHPAEFIPMQEFFDSSTNEFITLPEQRYEPFRLQLEHSLLSISKWESKWHKPFMSETQMALEEFRDYIKCMTINTPKCKSAYDRLTQEDFQKIGDYISDPMSAWEIRKKKKKAGRKDVVTSDGIYAAMIAAGIPFECEKWHFNRLLALLDVCESQGAQDGYKTGKSKSQREIMEMYRALNEKNRAKFHSKG